MLSVLTRTGQRSYKLSTVKPALAIRFTFYAPTDAKRQHGEFESRDINITVSLLAVVFVASLAGKWH